jgi:hypothetical protein
MKIQMEHVSEAQTRPTNEQSEETRKIINEVSFGSERRVNQKTRRGGGGERQKIVVKHAAILLMKIFKAKLSEQQCSQS